MFPAGTIELEMTTTRSVASRSGDGELSCFLVRASGPICDLQRPYEDAENTLDLSEVEGISRFENVAELNKGIKRDSTCSE